MSSLAFASFEAWEYPDIAAPSPASPPPEERVAESPLAPALVGFTAEEVLARVTEALQTGQEQWAAEADVRESQRRAEITRAMDAFAVERARYFQRVEVEVVQLALAIARKILFREAELDPTLLGALVRIALDRMGAGPAVRLRLPPARVVEWQKELAGAASRYEFELLPDEGLAAGDCIVETDLGRANFGFESQLKEVEQGLLDLLAHRPPVS